MYEIRYANTGDAGTLGRILLRSWRAAYKGIVPGSVLNGMTPEKTGDRLRESFLQGFEGAALIFADGEAAGLMCFGGCRDEDMDGSVGEIWGMYLLPEYWKKGIGSYFMDWALGELKARRYEKAVLWVLSDNLNARRFYEKRGFRHDGTVKRVTIGRELEECRYEKRLK